MASRAVLGLCLGLVLLACSAPHAQGAVSYDRTATLGSTANFTISWKVEAPRIYLALHSTTTGWMALGLGEPTSGSMPGADILVAGLNSQGVAYVQDRYAVAKATPSLDAGQDWTVTEGSRVNGLTTIHAWRLLDTGNKAEDRVFSAGPLKVIYALGLGSTDFVYHDVNRGATSISFYGAGIPDASVLGGTPSTYLVNNYTIPAKKKTYACKSFDLDDMVTPRHVIAFEPLLSPASAKYVHHIVFHACSNSTWFNQYKENTAECSSPVGSSSSGCMEVFWMWAVGGGPFILPADVGVRIGTGGIQRIVMQFHYDNPARITGIVDSSGFRMYSQTTLRAHEAGVMILGDPFTSGGTIPKLTSSFHTEFACNPTCTQTFSSPITVYASALHMHAYGKQMWTSQHNSSGALVRVTNKIEYWDFEFQQFSPLEPFVINKGDRLNTHCIYDTTSTIADVTFGTDSLQEMCFDFLMYYPRMANFDYCGAAGPVSVCAQAFGAPSPNLAYPDPAGQEVRIFGNPNSLSSSTGSNVMSSSGSASTGSDVTITYPLTINGVRHVYTSTKVIGNGITIYWKVTGGVLDFVCRRVNSGWLAFGFGSEMLGSHAVLGWKTISNDSSVAVYALTAKTTSGVQPVSASVASDYVTSREVDYDAAGYTSLRITRPLVLASGTISLTTETPMIFAYSSQVPMTASNVRQHDGITMASVLFSATGGGAVSSAPARAASVWSAVTVLALVAVRAIAAAAL